jgi:hypothetical protein
MSASTTSLSAKLYHGTVENSLTWNAYQSVLSPNGYVSRQIYDTKLVTILKNVGYKTSMLCLAVLAPIEWVARTSLSLVAYSFSLISTPIEWTLKTPFSLVFYKQLPTISISNKIYQFAYDLSNYNYGIAGVSGCAISNLLLHRNNLTHGLLD